MASTTDGVNSSSTLDKLVPTDIDSSKIELEKNPACVKGALHEINLWAARTGQFQTLIHEGAVILPSGKFAVDSSDSAHFVLGKLNDETKYSLSNPCPDTVTRLAEYNDVQTAAGEATSPSNKKLPFDSESTVVVNKLIIAKELSLLATAITNTIVDREWAALPRIHTLR